ncbi:hypothetical protein [Pseudomonas sp. MWU13-3659]|uniref:hypothetical protein n=1 Tax=Pseudomonas sp. MWU13-3659 TaxID=2986964 RepID=UPI002074F402|nr:hypothetical protein [Pseudomonas sp. MWU13-3659]
MERHLEAQALAILFEAPGATLSTRAAFLLIYFIEIDEGVAKALPQRHEAMLIKHSKCVDLTNILKTDYQGLSGSA